MSSQQVIAIFDVGKTNKKIFLFDQQYRIVFEEQTGFPEITDEDGDPCEDLDRLMRWVKDALQRVLALPAFTVRAVNFSGYGASFVHLGKNGQPLTPLYNYLKPLPPAVSEKFYSEHGGKLTFSILTASPVLGNLNSGMQLYWLKETKPEIFRQITCSLHLPQFLSWLVSGKAYSEITSIGCHTNLWNFGQRNYHDWVYREGLERILPPLVSSSHCEEVVYGESHFQTGVGLHDSSAALIPYLESFLEPFVLISTGTWCINLNPVNNHPLTMAELKEDCLCYLSFQGRPVKASRIFAGYWHEQESKRIAAFFHCSENFYTAVRFDPPVAAALKNNPGPLPERQPGKCLFAGRDLSRYANNEEAYQQLILDIMQDQKHSLRLVLQGTSVKRIFVDGGFSKNKLYMHLLAEAFDDIEVFAASIPQASAIGAAMAIHKTWNDKSLPDDIIDLKFYAPVHAGNG